MNEQEMIDLLEKLEEAICFSLAEFDEGKNGFRLIALCLKEVGLGISKLKGDKHE